MKFKGFKISSNQKLAYAQAKTSSKLEGNFWYFSAYLLLVLLAYLSLTPDLDQYLPKTVIRLIGETPAHFFGYLAAMYFFCRAYSRKFSPLKIALTLIILGVFIEFLQELQGPPRGFTLTDVISNFMGVALGFLLFIIQRKIFSPRTKNTLDPSTPGKG